MVRKLAGKEACKEACWLACNYTIFTGCDYGTENCDQQ